MRGLILELAVQLGEGRAPLLLGKGFVPSQSSIDFGAMIEVVGQRRVDVREREVVLDRDLVDALAHPLMPDRDVLDRDAAAGDAGLATRDPGRDLDVTVQDGLACPSGAIGFAL